MHYVFLNTALKLESPTSYSIRVHALIIKTAPKPFPLMCVRL